MEIFHKKNTKEYQKITFSVENDFKIGLKNHFNKFKSSRFQRHWRAYVHYN